MPATSANGNYTVNWWQDWGLLEQTNGGAWVNVQNPYVSSSKSFSGKANGTYKYKTYLTLGYPINATLYSAEAQIVVSLPVPSTPPSTFTVPGTDIDGSYTLSWSSVTYANRYTLQEKIGSGSWVTVQDTSVLSKSFSGKGDNTYSYRVRACNETGCSSYSATKSVVVLHIPGTPGSISGPATDTDGSFSVSWGTSTGSVASYKLQERINSGSWSTIQNTAATSKTFSSKPDNRYDYRVQACNGSGCSGWTGTKTVIVARVPGIPGNVTGAPEENTDGNFSVSWSVASGTVTRYELQEAIGSSSWNTVYTGSALSRSFSGKGIGNYGYRVRACNQVSTFSACSEYGYSNAVVVAQLILTAPATSTGNYTVSWSGSSTGGEPLWLQESTNGGAWTTVYTGSNSSYSFSNKPSGDYSYRMVQQLCGILGGGTCFEIPVGNSVDVQVVPAPPGAISLPATDTDGSYTVSWGASASAGVDRYVLQQRINSGGWATISDANTTSYNLSGQNSGVYDYRAQACSGSYCSGWTGIKTTTVALAPAVPPSLTVSPTNSGDGTFSTSWGASTGTISHYQLQQQFNSGSWSDIYTDNGLSYFVSGLSDGLYRYRVRACNTVNSFTSCSSYRQSSNVTVELVAGVLAPPTPILATAPAPSAASDSIGATAGQFRVDESGAATYSVPLALPAGTAGVAPQLSLNYSSQQGNGLLGQGWSLGGVSAITRCRQTLAQDGQVRPITGSEEDRFCLDGQRLVLTSAGQYGAVGATYKTETDRFAIITAMGGSLGHPDYFTVAAKDGSTRTYGNTADATLSVGGFVLTWSQNRFEDSVGNGIDYVYAGSGSHRLTQVLYAEGAGSPAAQIDLAYTGNRPDPLGGYIAGNALNTTHRLSNITVYNDGAEVRRYDLTYADVSARENKTSQLTQVQECAGSICLPATQFTWANQAVGLSLNPSGSATFSSQSDRGLYTYQPADINGDGYMDLVWLEWDVDGSDTDHHLHYKLSDGQTLENALFTNNSGAITYGEDVGSELVKIQIIDYNVDGRQDVIVYNSRTGRWRVLLATPQGDGTWRLSSTPLDTPVTDSSATFMDINADGLVDAVYMRNRDLYQQLLEVDDSESESSDHRYHFSGETLLGALDTSELGTVYPTYYNQELTGNLDFNGDGAVDLYLRGNEQLNLGGGLPTLNVNVSSGLLLSDSGFEPYFVINDPQANTVNPDLRMNLLGVDFNGDGLTDIVYQLPDGTGQWFYRLNTGTGFTVETSLEIDGDDPTPADYNQDGYPDLFWRDTDANKLKVQVWNGGGFNASIDLRSISSANHAHLFFDMNGDGVVDYVRVEESSLSTYPSVSPHQPRNKIIGITNGLGSQTDITYGSLSHSGRYSRVDVSTAQTCNTIEIPYPYGGGSTTYCTTDASEFYSTLNGDWPLPTGSQTLGKDKPVLELTGPIYVVTDVASSAPAATSTPGAIDAGAQSSISYYYGEAKIQAVGRGMLGFQTIKTVDNQTGVITTTAYRQDFPFTGLPLTTEVRSAQGHLLSRATNTWELQQWNGGNPSAPYQPFIAESVEDTYELVNNGASAGSLLHTVTTQFAYDGYGNPTSIVVDTEDGAGSIISTTSTVNTYGSSVWEKEKGRLTRTEVTTTRGSESLMRTSAFTYYTSGSLQGLLQSEIIEPDTPAYTLTTTYEYDFWGNKTKVTQSGNGVPSRVSESFYDNAGRYVEQTKNAYEQITRQVLARDIFGQPTQLIDINGVVTELAYGSLGRKYFEAHETGAFVQTYLSECDSSCPASGEYIVQVSEAGGAERREIFDNLGRVIRAATRQFDGSWGYVDTEYDSLGRVKRKSEPHNGVAQYWTEFEYDILGRVISTELPGVAIPVSIDYSGLTTVTTNPVGQTHTETKNALGEVVEVYDAENGRLSYSYDPLGNLRFVTSHGSSSDPHAVVVEMQYDLLGRKIAMNDPDKGSWSYTYNVFGELTAQTDAKNQSSVQTYDLLGRLINRVDTFSGGAVESDTTWTYNNATTGSAQGALLGVADSVSGYTKMIGYDVFGRVEDTITQLAANDDHDEKVTYDQYGRAFQVFDAAGDGTWQDNAIQNIYNAYGYLHKVVDAVRLLNGEHRATYYTVQEMDLRGNVIEYLSGNGITGTRYFDPATGRLLNLEADLMPGSGDVQDLTYSWDDIGNLLSRQDQSGSKNVSESFQYDGLNRLTQTQVGGQTAKTVQYDSLGNITYKSDVGSYTYGANAGPHAVTATSDGVTYVYDANGNMTGDSSGRSLTYTTFDKPNQISKGGHTTTFKYGPDRSRYLRTDTDSGGTTTTRYIGNVEKITRPDNSREIKRYLPGGALVTISLDSGGNVLNEATQYLYKDHLGSVDVITDATGAVVQQLSFDAWGQRRAAIDWANLDVTSLINFDHSQTTRGFTGHEMLDEVGLIHMNGRIYDPRLGRFLQADPFIDGVTDTQGYNRYNYVGNNPLTYTDPTGNFKLRQWVGAIVGVIGAVICGPACAQFGWQVVTVGAAAGAAGAAANGGNILKGAILGGISAAAFSAVGGSELFGYSVGDGLGQLAMNALGNGLVGGIMNVLQGGKFGHGFAAAGLTAFAKPGIRKGFGTAASGLPFRVAVRAILGGTISKLTGGKFSNGAATAAFSQLFNEELSLARYNEQKQEAKDAYDSLETTLRQRAADNPEGVLELSVDEVKVIAEWTRYRTIDMPRRESLFGEWDEASIKGDFSSYDTFLRDPVFSSRQFNINGEIAWGGHINYMAVGMLAAHYGPNMYQAIPGLVTMHNVNQIYEGQGWRNLRDIGPGIKWAVVGANYYNRGR